MAKLCVRHWVYVCNIFVLSAPCPGIADLRHGYSMLQYGRKLDRRQITSYDKYSILDCVEDCLRTPRCQSINYYKGANFCQTNFESRTSEPDLYIEKPGWIYSAKEDWDKEVAGACSKSNCAINEKCIPKPFGQFACILSDCGIPLNESFSMDNVQEWDAIGLTRGIHVTCSCGYLQEGSELFVCRSDGTWRINLNCTLKTCPVKYSEVTVNTSRVCLRFHETSTSYPNASRSCKRNGGDLIKIDKPAMLHIFFKFLEERGNKEIWIQGEKDNDNVWKFHDDTDMPDFLREYMEETNTTGETTLRYDSSKGKFLDREPNYNFSFVNIDFAKSFCVQSQDESVPFIQLKCD